MNYLLTPSQVQSGQAIDYKTFRLGGMVKAGSIQRSKDWLKVTFTVVDAGGHMYGARFVSTEVLAKHDETYMPKELKDAMAKAHADKKIEDAGNGNRGTGNGGG